jgi:hypothetical protein
MLERTESFLNAEAAGKTWLRHAPRPEDSRLLPHTRNWLDALPKYARPVHLPQEFPRIANDLSRLWAEAAALDRYFEEKEFSPRAGRSGFAPLIREELMAMHVYALHSRPASQAASAPQRAFVLR